MSKPAPKETNMNIDLTDQIAYNDATGNETILTGTFQIVDFSRVDQATDRYNDETVLTWTVTDGNENFGFSRVLPASGTVDFGASTSYDRNNIG